MWRALQKQLEQEKPEVTPAQVLQGKDAEERDDALFDSSRDYLTQNEIYQTHKGNETEEEE